MTEHEKCTSLDIVRIGVIGLGYVGLPLAVEFGRKFPTVGFDINQRRVDELVAGRICSVRLCRCDPEICHVTN